MKEIKLSLSIDEANVLHKIATEERQKELEQLFPELKPKLITDRVKSYEDALRILNREHFDETNLNTREIARRKLEIIIEAINEGWKPDFMNKKQVKWYCYLYINNTGFGCSHALLSPAYASALKIKNLQNI